MDLYFLVLLLLYHTESFCDQVTDPVTSIRHQSAHWFKQVLDVPPHTNVLRKAGNNSVAMVMVSKNSELAGPVPVFAQILIPRIICH